MAGEEFTQDLRRNSVTWWLADPAAVADWDNPTAAELNTAEERLVLNITCALDEDSTTFTVGSSELDERLTFCDSTGISRPTQVNPEAALGILRDEDRTATGIFNTALEWLMFPDKEYYLIQRVGDQEKGPEAAISAADDLRIMKIRTDYPVDTLTNGDPAMIMQNVLPAGWLRWNLPVVA